VEAFDVNDVSRGAVFRVHVTAVIPIPLQERNAVELPLVNYEPNMIKRNFFFVPRGANSVGKKAMKINSKRQEVTLKFYALSV